MALKSKHQRALIRPSLAPAPEAIESLLADSLARRLLGTNILLHGPPGTGKTELSRALATKLQVPLYEVGTTDVDGATHAPMARLHCASTAHALLGRERCLLVFDEIDAVFTDGSEFFGKPTTAESAKAWVNDLLESNSIPTIWIANRIRGMDPAFIRRFDLVVEGGVPPKAARLELLQAAATFLPPAKIKRLAQVSSATPAVILRAVRTVQRMGASAGDQVRTLDQVLDGVLRAQGLPSVLRECRSISTDGYDPSMSNADVDLEALTHSLRKNPTGRLCLYGPAGTGKTAFGLWLADQLGRPMHLKRVSDLQSPFLGETERLLAQAFERASQEGAVLQIDEVDSFLQDRRNARHGWEVTQVNEFLTQLESYSGVFIASTNLQDSLDPASLRRFDFKVRMDYMNSVQVERMFMRLLHELGLDAPVHGVSTDLSRLTQLTPGDFAVIRRQHACSPFEDSSQAVKALAHEQTLKGPVRRRVGFI